MQCIVLYAYHVSSKDGFWFDIGTPRDFRQARHKTKSL